VVTIRPSNGTAPGWRAPGGWDALDLVLA
jgi:hypothetical protein